MGKSGESRCAQGKAGLLMEWNDGIWSGNRHFKACQKCVAPKRHPRCHDHCEEYAAEKAAYEEIKASMDKMKEVGACIRETDNRVKAHRRLKRKET